MPFLIATDEAGYGPNLGPLVVSASVWEVPEGVTAEGLFHRLEGTVRPPGPRMRPVDCAPAAAAEPLLFGDSKRLFQQGGGLGELERGLYSGLGVLGQTPRTWVELFAALDPTAVGRWGDVPWYAAFAGGPPRAVPVEADPLALEPAAGRLAAGLAAAGVRLVELSSRVVFAHEMNDGIDRLGSKGAVLSSVTLALAAAQIAALAEDDDAPVAVVCDKHGGRNRYGDLLAAHFDDAFIEIHGESRAQSVYRFGWGRRRVSFCFRSGAEECLPAALASMASKYLRELAMEAFNAFWTARVAGLKPTAGYPLDARRFRSQIAAAAAEMGLDDRLLWRKR